MEQTTTDPEKIENFEPLTKREIPNISNDQLAKFDTVSIHAHEIATLNPRDALSKLQAKEGQKVIGADFGGDKGVIRLFMVKNGVLVDTGEYDSKVQGNEGEGYVEKLEDLAYFAQKEHIPIGISWGGPLEGTKPLDTPKFQKFLDILNQKYDGNFTNLLPTLKSCINDGPAGLVKGSIEAAKQSLPVENVLFPINGGGLGMAVLKNDIVYSTEAGHVEGSPELNQCGISKPCGVFGSSYVCLENLGANKAGIEAQWQNKTGSYMRARNIEDRYKEGDKLAGDLYENSAWIVAHLIAGTAKAFDIDLRKETTIVGHGGAFWFPYYGERVQQIIGGYLGEIPNLIMTKDFTDAVPAGERPNACLDGAALNALIKD